jgi:hypothetical protein
MEQVDRRQVCYHRDLAFFIVGALREGGQQADLSRYGKLAGDCPHSMVVQSFALKSAISSASESRAQKDNDTFFVTTVTAGTPDKYW